MVGRQIPVYLMNCTISTVLITRTLLLSFPWITVVSVHTAAEHLFILGTPFSSRITRPLPRNIHTLSQLTTLLHLSTSSTNTHPMARCLTGILFPPPLL